MSFEELAARRPGNIDEALAGMAALLEWYHQEGDHRAVFLRAHYLVTLNVHAAVNGRPRRLFFDPQWVSTLMGKLTALYFESLDPRIQLQVPAWKTAHARAKAKELPVAQDLLLGLNAHVNFDMAWGIYLNLVEHGDHKDHNELPRRKFDHDQVNNLFVASLPQVQQTLWRDYGGELDAVGRALVPLDDLVTKYGLKNYRERVWWNAVGYISGRSEEELALMRTKLNLEAQMLANALIAEPSGLQRAAGAVGAMFSRVRPKKARARWAEIALERPGGTSDLMAAAISPY